MRTVADKGNERTLKDPWPIALRLLTRGEMSTADLRHRLNERGCETSAIEATLTRCRECGYLDDRRYADLRARSLLRQGRAVGVRILADLKRHGIDEATARNALAEAATEHGEDTVLEALLEKRFPGFDYDSAPDKERRRVVHFLQRRGFPLGRILDRLTRKGSSTR